MTALFWADARIARATLRAIVRSPGRLVLWLAVAAITIGLLVLRARLFVHVPFVYADLVRADVAVCAFLAYAGATLVIPGRLTGLFAHRAEARWIATAPYDAGPAIAYIQARTAFRLGLRVVPSFAFSAIALAPRSVAATTLATDLVLALVAIAALVAVALPRELASPPVRRAAIAGGAALCAGAVVIAARDLLVQYLPFAPITLAIVRIPPLHPGALLLGGAGAPALAAAIGAAIVALCCAAVARLGRTRMPELYDLSLQRIELWDRRRRRARAPDDGATLRTAASAGTRIWPGAFAFVWKNWLEERRRATRLAIAVRTAGPLLAGFAVGRFAHGDATYFAILASLANFQIVFAPVAGATLNREVRRPLFWLADITIFERIAGTMCALWLQMSALCWLGALGAFAGGAPAYAVTVVAVTLPAQGVVAVGAGALIAALFPAAIDQQGPGSLLRMAIAYLALAPAAIVFIVVAVAAGITAGAFAGAVVAAAEGFVVLALAAWRFDGRVDRVAP